MTLLMNLTKKNIMFHWSDKTDKAFKQLKNIFIIVSILMQFNLNYEIVIEADFLKYVINSLLQQYNNNNVLQSCAFFFKKNLLTECNYEIYNKKLLIIVLCLRKWDLKLCNVRKFRIVINYKNLIYFIMIWRLNKKQMC